MTPSRSAKEWASEWDGLQRCPHMPPHDNEEEYLSAASYDACLAEFFIAYAAEQVAQARAECVQIIDEQGAEGEHDRDYYIGYEQAKVDAIAALRARRDEG